MVSGTPSSRQIVSVTSRVSRPEKRVALLFDEVGDDLAEVLGAARRLRSAGVSVSLEVRRKNSSRQLQELREHGHAGYALFGGADGPEIHWFPGVEG